MLIEKNDCFSVHRAVEPVVLPLCTRKRRRVLVGDRLRCLAPHDRKSGNSQTLSPNL